MFMAKKSVPAKNTKLTEKKYSFRNVFPWFLVISAAIGLIRSVFLTIEKIHLLNNQEASLA